MPPEVDPSLVAAAADARRTNLRRAEERQAIAARVRTKLQPPVLPVVALIDLNVFTDRKHVQGDAGARLERTLRLQATMSI